MPETGCGVPKLRMAALRADARFTALFLTVPDAPRPTNDTMYGRIFREELRL
jgi:hypothetical protein